MDEWTKEIIFSDETFSFCDVIFLYFFFLFVICFNDYGKKKKKQKQARSDKHIYARIVVLHIFMLEPHTKDSDQHNGIFGVFHRLLL